MFSAAIILFSWKNSPLQFFYQYFIILILSGLTTSNCIPFDPGLPALVAASSRIFPEETSAISDIWKKTVHKHLHQYAAPIIPQIISCKYSSGVLKNATGTYQ